MGSGDNRYAKRSGKAFQGSLQAQGNYIVSDFEILQHAHSILVSKVGSMTGTVVDNGILENFWVYGAEVILM